MRRSGSRFGRQKPTKPFSHNRQSVASAYSLLTINPKEVKRAGACALDGRLQNDAGRRIAEHYADTGGFTDHVFAACSILGFRFAPRIRDLADKRLYVFDPKTTWIQDIVPQQQAMRADLNGSQIDEAAGERI